MGEAVHEMSASPARGWLRLAPAVTVAAFLLPIAAGLAGTLLPAFGYLPAIGGHAFTLEPWRRLIDAPGFATSARVTLVVGLATPLLACAIAFGFCAWAHDRALMRRIGVWLSPILAAPHSALAIGVAFLLAPSGWIARALSPWLTGWALPPDVATVGDANGVALVVGMLVKEVPYLVLMIAAALHQVPVREHMAIARALGYSRETAWLKAILPQVYTQVRLPIFAVIAFSLSVVDVALILGPSNPPTLAVLAFRWFGDPDVALYFPAAAAATLVFATVASVIAAWWLGERVVAMLGLHWIERGGRGGIATALCAFVAAMLALLVALALLAMLGMALWSVAAQWRFPEALPDAWSPDVWMRRWRALAAPAWNTIVVGIVATAIAFALAVACLENESRSQRRAGTGALWLLYLPLLVPQIAFLFGAQVLLVRAGLDGTLIAVVWAHLVFALPYLFLSLADPWRELDPRYARSASSLGATPRRVLVAVKLPILMRPALVACAVAFAVSVALYLPTLFAGNGRVATLTTDAVTLASGADRRVVGAYALLQAVLPLLAYLVAALLPALIYTQRKSR